MEQNSGTEVYKYTEVFRSPSEHEFATFCFDEKTCEIAMHTYFFREIATFISRL